MSGSIVGTPIHMAPELFTGTLHFITGVCSFFIIPSQCHYSFLQGSTITLWMFTLSGSSSGTSAPVRSNSQKPLRNAPARTSSGTTSKKVRGDRAFRFALQLVCRLITAAVPPSRSETRAAALLRRGVLAADGGLLERRPFPEAPAWNRGAQPAKHDGPSVLRLGAEEQQPRGLQLNPLPPAPLTLCDSELLCIYEQYSLNIPAFSCWIYIIYEQSRPEVLGFFLCLCSVYLYTNSVQDAIVGLITFWYLDTNCFKK